MNRLNVTRIPTPNWARASNVWLTRIRLADYQAIQNHRDQLLETVHREVVQYLNTPELASDTGDFFPSLQRLTGEYYVGDESYETLVNPVRYRIKIMACFVEHSIKPGQIELDYLGLEVWCECFPDEWRFISNGTVNASVI